VRRTHDNKSKVVAVRLDPTTEHRLRLLAAITRRKQSVFLQQMIEQGLAAIEDLHLPSEVVARIRAGELPPVPGEEQAGGELDLFSDQVTSTPLPARRRTRKVHNAES
jgi:RHH-type rel operon transcriptional repressor/antitoxin RelB